jgi:hypothetical protein
MSSPLRSYRPRQLSRAFEAKLDIPFRGDRHRSGWYTLGERKLFRIVMPKTHRDWSIKTKATMFTATRLSPEEFDDLVRCPMTGPQFEARARELFMPD